MVVDLILGWQHLRWHMLLHVSSTQALVGLLLSGSCQKLSRCQTLYLRQHSLWAAVRADFCNCSCLAAASASLAEGYERERGGERALTRNL